MTASPAASRYFERIEFSADPALPQLDKLFDSDWVWQRCHPHLPAEYGEPRRIRIRRFLHSIGRSATVCYEVEWAADRYLPAEFFVARISHKNPLRIDRFPQDERLPGLAAAARPASALRLVNQHVFKLPVRRARVQIIRYRPSFRAVLRHGVGKAKLYARVVRPAEFDTFLSAYQRSAQSGFVVPGLAGYWAEGGIMWLAEIRGRNVRALVRQGRAPPPERLLSGLEALWEVSSTGAAVRPFDLSRAYRQALRSFRHHLRDHQEAARVLPDIAAKLTPFVRSWRPCHMAHNDFYDDQLLVLSDERIALVDFEAIAPGDRLLDIGNFLSHLRWSACFAPQWQAENCEAYYRQFRGAALERFGLEERRLILGEAVCLFRICTNAIRHPRPNWLERLTTGLRLVQESLD